MKYLKNILPWLLLGPVTGMLAEGIFRNWREGQRILAYLYAIALWLMTYDLFALSKYMLAVH